MADWMNLLMLVSAVVGATALGILMAYGVLRVGFSLMRRPQRLMTPVKARAEAAPVS